MTPNPTKNISRHASRHHLLGNKCVFCAFLQPGSARLGFRNDVREVCGRCPGGVREVAGRFKGSTDLRRLSKSARLASRWLQRGPRTPPGNSAGRFCDGFSIHFLLQFAMKISGKKLGNIEKKCDSDGDDPRTLDRYIIYGYIHIDIYTTLQDDFVTAFRYTFYFELRWKFQEKYKKILGTSMTLLLIY